MFSKNTKILIIGLVVVIAILGLLIFISNINQTEEGEPGGIPVFDKPTATPFSQTIPLDPLQQQTEADINVIQLQNNVLQEFPWYNNLPLQEPNYFVLFDLQRKVFRAKLYPEQPSATQVDDQVSFFQKEITQRLQQLNIDTNLYKIEWTVTVE